MKKDLNLTADETKILETIYGKQFNDLTGYNPNKLDDVLELNETEKKSFAKQNFVSPHFFMQTLYKIRGRIKPLKFSLAIKNMLDENKNLRVNFCNVGTRILKVVRAAGFVKPQIVFRNFTRIAKEDLEESFRKLMVEDMHRDVDLQRDSLIHFTACRTDEDEFALLVTVAQVIADSFNERKFIADALGIPEDNGNTPVAKDTAPPVNPFAVKEYWNNFLKTAPPLATLPVKDEASGTFSQKVFYAEVPADILSFLRDLFQSNRLMTMVFLQTAWGFMLQVLNKRSDIMFFQTLNTGGNKNTILNFIPISLTDDKDLAVKDIVRKQFRQFIISQTYSSVSWDTFVDLVTSYSEIAQEKNKLDHFLCFKEFQTGEADYNDTPADEYGKVIFRNSWDAEGLKLAVYFRYCEKKIDMTFIYDEHQFLPDTIENIFSMYEMVLKQMIVDLNATHAEFMAKLNQRMESSNEETEEETRKKIRNFLSQLPVLQGKNSGISGLFENRAELVTYYAGDRLSSDLLSEKFFFVVDGQLSRNIDDGNGWYDSIDIIEKNSFVNPTYLLAEQSIKISAGILSEQAELLIIPRAVLLDAMKRNHELTMSLLNYALKEIERGHSLYIKS